MNRYDTYRFNLKLGLTAPKEKKIRSIAPLSKKRKRENKDYEKKKKEYLTKNIRCEVKGCNQVSVDIHHKKGRVGKLLHDERYFMAVCRKHHTEIEISPSWAIEQGYSLQRLKIRND